jgi:histone acetyltransferase (RNA polymerase elongator complex component)
MKNNRLLIAPVFIPHEGCPYRCVFCSQTDITGSAFQADEENVLSVLKTYLYPTLQSDKFSRREVAFYGGSFTGLSDERQEFLLSLIKPLVDDGRVDAIRVSTHPLFINKKQLERLKAFGVETVELGIQSTNQEVLEKSGRPCSNADMLSAVSLIREYDLKLGLQLMLGLPGDNENRFEMSVADIIGMKPDFVRLYPALVLRHTPLFSMYQKGVYSPWSLERTLGSLKNAVKSFGIADIPIIRIGLQPDNSLRDNFVAGPFHPSLRYLVDCRIGLDLMVDRILSLNRVPERVVFKVPMKSVSIYTGNRRENLKILKERFSLEEIKLSGEEHCRQLELVA